MMTEISSKHVYGHQTVLQYMKIEIRIADI